MKKTIIVGVGGAGCAIAEKLGQSAGYDVLLVNSSENRLEEKAAQHRLYLNIGSQSGRLPTVMTAEAAVEKGAAEFRKIIAGNQRVILVVGLGGVTGSGATPALAEIARSSGMHITAVATRPFSFEKKSLAIADTVLPKLKEHVDVLILHDHSTASHCKSPLQESLDEYFDRVAKELGSRLEQSLT
ncbi:MAG: hypothetical protein KIG95_09090 [Comamonas sp.]|nr:hypothetical protein [Comamonas sp.]